MGAKQKLAKKRQESPTATSNEDLKRDDDVLSSVYNSTAESWEEPRKGHLTSLSDVSDDEKSDKSDNGETHQNNNSTTDIESAIHVQVARYDIEHGIASCSKDNGPFSQREGPSCDRGKEFDSGYASKSAKGAKQKLA